LQPIKDHPRHLPRVIFVRYRVLSCPISSLRSFNRALFIVSHHQDKSYHTAHEFYGL